MLFQQVAQIQGYIWYYTAFILSFSRESGLGLTFIRCANLGFLDKVRGVCK